MQIGKLRAVRTSVEAAHAAAARECEAAAREVDSAARQHAAAAAALQAWHQSA